MTRNVRSGDRADTPIADAVADRDGVRRATPGAPHAVPVSHGIGYRRIGAIARTHIPGHGNTKRSRPFSRLIFLHPGGKNVPLLTDRQRADARNRYQRELNRMTFSIAALCPRTGELGCVLATSSMAAGARAQFVSAEAGVVLSQARSDPRLGAIGIARLQAGDGARAALDAMIGASPHAARAPSPACN